MAQTEQKKYDVKSKLLPFLIFWLAAGWLFYRIYPIIMGTHDDMLNYSLMRLGTMAENGFAAAKRGRISQIWDYWLLGFPFLLNKLWFYKLVVYTCYLFDVGSVWLFLSRHVNRDFAALTSILIAAWSTVTNYHNLLISYGCCHQLPLGFVFLSLYFYCCFLKEKKKRDLIFSSVFLLFAVMIYEAFATLLLLFGLLALLHFDEEKTTFFRQIGKTIQRIWLPTLLVCVYMAVYFIWQHYYPSSYDGTSMDFSHPASSLRALLYYSLGFFPVSDLIAYVKVTPCSIGDLLYQVQIPTIIVAILVCVAAVILIPRICIEKRVVWRTMLLSGIGMFLPCLLISFSPKYREWSERGVIAYLPSYYSYFFLMIFLLCLAWGAYRLCKQKISRISVLVTLSGTMFCVTIASGIVTNIWCTHYKTLSMRYRNFDYVASTEPVMNCDEAWQIYGPDNGGIHYADRFTEQYLHIYNHDDVRYFHEPQNIADDRRILCLRSPENYEFSVLGETDEHLHAESVILRTLLPERFEVVLQTVSGETVTYPNVMEGDVLTAPEGDAFDLSVRVRMTE